MSRPARARGLKLVRGARNLDGDIVAPRAGAWIETTSSNSSCCSSVSRPARARGLKLASSEVYTSPSRRAPRGRVD